MSENWDDLFEKYLSEELDFEGKKELTDLLESNPEAKRYFVEFCEFNSALNTVLKTQRDLDLKIEISKVPEKKHTLKNYIPWIITAAACLLLFLKNSSEPHPSDQTAQLAEDKNLTAILVNEANVKFANNRTVDDVKIYPGNFKLTEGVVHIRFTSGADMVVEAPAELKLIDSMNVTLLSGKVRAMVPPPAHGFTLKAYDLDYEDIGTEFGLSVNSTDHSSELHVFDGQVNVKNSKNDQLIKKVFKGQAVSYLNPETFEYKDLKPDMFTSMSEIGYHRWKNQSNNITDDPDLIGSFLFENTSGKILKNRKAMSLVSDGEIHGATWVSGRWPGKKALLFDRDTDYVEIDVPVETDEFSVAMWVKIDRLDYFLSALFNSNGWDKGDIHLQVQNSRVPHMDIFESFISHNQQFVNNNKVPLNGWTHITGVFSSRQNYGKIYINGSLSVEGKFRQNAIIKPGKCRLGNWQPIEGYEPNRSFKGRIDELTLWQKALSSKDISSLVEKGRPSVLWSVNTQ